MGVGRSGPPDRNGEAHQLITRVVGRVTNGGDAGVGLRGISQSLNAAIAATGIYGAFQFDPDGYSIAGKTLRLRLASQLITNDVAPASDFTFGLYPLASAAGNPANSIVLGSLVPGSAPAPFVAPLADLISPLKEAIFAPPAASGLYVIGVTTTAPLAANSSTMLLAALEATWV